MATPTILKGDDTASNGRSIRLTLPDVDIGNGYEVLFELQGMKQTGAYSPGGTIDFNFSREATARLPLGISLGSLRLVKDGLVQTICNTVPVRVTDSVAEAEAAAGGDGSLNTINLAVVVNTCYVPVAAEQLTQASTIAELRAAVNAILAALAGAE